MRTSFYVSIPVLMTLTSCISGGLESGEYDYNYDSPAVAGAEIPPEPEEAPPVVEAEPVVVHLKPGDTLYSLSVQYLGAGRRWREIASLNGLSDRQVRNLSIGLPIKLPAR